MYRSSNLNKILSSKYLSHNYLNIRKNHSDATLHLFNNYQPITIEPIKVELQFNLHHKNTKDLIAKYKVDGNQIIISIPDVKNITDLRMQNIDKQENNQENTQELVSLKTLENPKETFNQSHTFKNPTEIVYALLGKNSDDTKIQNAINEIIMEYGIQISLSNDDLKRIFARIRDYNYSHSKDYVFQALTFLLSKTLTDDTSLFVGILHAANDNIFALSQILSLVKLNKDNTFSLNYNARDSKDRIIYKRLYKYYIDNLYK